MNAMHEPLIDRFGRVHTSLRISVTDRCNIRCLYCMPAGPVRFKPRHQLLAFEEIERLTRVAAAMGVDRLRLTGGEPLVRADVPALVARLIRVPGIRELAMTTNGTLLADHASALKQAGLTRLNISLDAVCEETFRRVSRHRGVHRVVEGILAAKRAGFENIRLNAVAVRGVTDDEIVPLAAFARDHGVELRFIEFMPLDAEGNWGHERVLPMDTIRQRLTAAFGPLVPAPRPDPNQPAVDYQFADGRGRVGFISSVSHPFCDRCDRLRITAEGKVRNCLFSSEEWDARAALRSGGSDQELAALLRQCVLAKRRARGEDQPERIGRPERAMYEIGG